MKIKCTNFKCHTNATFEFPDTGLLLLSGASGSGKSTILKAILYAFYGSKAVKKPCSFGASTCSVKVDFADIHIHRTNRPNRLIVNELEDEVAQNYIDEKLGMNYEEFLISSYIPQKNNTSILSLAPNDQLAMIKVLAFKGAENTTFKNKILEMIRKSSDDLLALQTQLEFTQTEIERVSSNVTPIDFPLLLSNNQTPQDAIDIFHKRIKNFNKTITGLLEKKSTATNKIQQYEHLLTEITSIESKKSALLQEIQQLQNDITSLESSVEKLPTNIHQELNDIKNKIHYVEVYNEYKKWTEQYTQILTDEREERIQQQQQIEYILWMHKGITRDRQTSENDLNKLAEKSAILKQYTIACKKLSDLQKKLDQPNKSKSQLIDYYNKLIESATADIANFYRQSTELTIAAEKWELEKQIVYCPECNASLKWESQKLVHVHNHIKIPERDYKSELANIEHEQQKLEAAKKEYANILKQIQNIDIPVITEDNTQEDIDKQIATLTNFITLNKNREIELERIKKELANIESIPALKSLKVQIAECTKNLKLYTKTDENISILRTAEKELSIKSENYTKNTAELKRKKTILQKTQAEYDSATVKLQELLSKKNAINIQEVHHTLTIIDAEITTLKNTQEQDEKMVPKLEQYSKYCTAKTTIDYWNTQYSNIFTKTSIAEKIHAANCVLKEKYNQAEILAVETTMDSINEHTRHYLDTFFVENQLSIILKAVFSGKKIQSLKIDNVIEYKGHSYDNINQMSGGEFDRCTLASICGINNMLGSPILVLDESLSSLDADSNTEIISFLKELAQDKLIIVCSHEAVRGIFDHVIEI